MTSDDRPMVRFLEKTPGYTVPAILLGVPLLMTLLSQVSDAFYRNVVWKYWWGPIKADAYPRGSLLCSNGEPPVGLSCPDGHVIAEAGYNLVNTASWALLLALCLLGIAQIMHRLKGEVNNTVIVGSTGWVLAGSVFHVLQDANLFAQPLEFLFITPPIYLMFGAFGVFSFVYGHYARHIGERMGSVEAGLQKIWFMFMVIILGYTFLWLTQWDQVVRYLNPLWIAVAAVVTFAVVRWRVAKTGRIDPGEMTLIFSLGWNLIALVYVQTYLANPWPGEVPSDDLRYAWWVAPLASAAVAGIVYLVAKWRKDKGSKTAFAYMMPMNLLLIFSQMVDAFGTAIGIDLSTYTEKHVLSEGVRAGAENLWGALGWTWGEDHPTFTGFAAVKLAVSLLVVYAIDIQSKEDVKKYPTMIGLVKFAIIMVGIGPGVRNITRMSLGI
ncbi:MAG: DUF63 family protein [Thermoplasmatota archaeon]